MDDPPVGILGRPRAVLVEKPVRHPIHDRDQFATEVAVANQDLVGEAITRKVVAR